MMRTTSSNRPKPGPQRLVEPGDEPLVLGDARHELDEIGRAEHGIALHDPARRVARLVGPEAALGVGADEGAVLVVLEVDDLLAEVPDVARRVLREEVERVLEQQSVLVFGVAHHRRPDAADAEARAGRQHVGPCGRDLAGLGIGRDLAVACELVLQVREVRIVDRRAALEVGGGEVGKHGHVASPPGGPRGPAVSRLRPRAARRRQACGAAPRSAIRQAWHGKQFAKYDSYPSVSYTSEIDQTGCA